MRKFSGSQICLFTVALYAFSSTFAQLSEAAPQPSQSDKAATALTVSPACPEISNDPVTRQFKSETIVIRYDPAAKSAVFHSPSSLTLHVAPIGLGLLTAFKNVPLAPQTDGAWVGSFELTRAEASTGYVMFEIEDQAHQIDQNHGDFWDLQLCRFGRPGGAQMKAYSYEGHLLAPGMQRAADPARALTIVREDFAANPQNYGDLYSIWTLETEHGLGGPAEWAQVSRELDEALAQNATQPVGKNLMLMQTIGFVAFYQTKLDPSIVAKYRAAVVSLPQTEQPAQYGQDGKLHPIARTTQWDEALSRTVTELLSQLDFGQIPQSANPQASAEIYEAYARKYSDCKYCRDVAGAFAEAVRGFVKAADFDAAQRVELEWAAWDPKNPDPPARLAEEYLEANTRLEEALQLVNRATQLYVPCADVAQCQPRYREIRSQAFFVVSPGPKSKGKIEFLRGKIEAALGNWPAAAKDLQIAAAAMPEDQEVQLALGEANGHIGTVMPH